MGFRLSPFNSFPRVVFCWKCTGGLARGAQGRMVAVFLIQVDGAGSVSGRHHSTTCVSGAQTHNPGFLLLLAPSFKEMQSTPQCTAHLTAAPPILSGWRENKHLFVLSEPPHTTRCLILSIKLRSRDDVPVLPGTGQTHSAYTYVQTTKHPNT